MRLGVLTSDMTCIPHMYAVIGVKQQRAFWCFIFHYSTPVVPNQGQSCLLGDIWWETFLLSQLATTFQWVEARDAATHATLPRTAPIAINWCHVWLSHVWLCNPMDYTPPGASVHRIFQAKNYPAQNINGACPISPPYTNLYLCQLTE